MADKVPGSGRKRGSGGLTPIQRRFVDEYLIDCNATQAALRAGYSEKNAYATGQRLATKVPHVKELIELKMKARASRLRITQDRILDEIAVIAFSDLKDYSVSEVGDVELTEKARDDAMRALSSIKRKRRVMTDDRGDTVETEVEIKLWDKVAALKLAGQHLGMFIEKDPQLSPLDVARAVREAVKAMNAADGLADAA